MARLFMCILVGSICLPVLSPVLAQTLDAAETAGRVVSFGEALEGDIYAASFKSIMILLVLAVLIESALEVLFNWRVFRAYFSLGGIKTVISFAVSLLVVQKFGLDVMSSLLDIYTEGPNYPSTLGTQVLTAAIIAGGSSGVNTLLGALGYRTPASERDAPMDPPADNAWIAVRVHRKNAVGPVHVHLTEEPDPPEDLTSIAGTCLKGRPSLKSLLFRNDDRFPQNGGHAIKPGQAFRLSVSSTDDGGQRISGPVTAGPIKLAPGAVVDFEVTL